MATLHAHAQIITDREKLHATALTECVREGLYLQRGPHITTIPVTFVFPPPIKAMDFLTSRGINTELIEGSFFM